MTFCYEIQYEEGGQTISVGPHTAMALFEYPTPFEVVGLAEPLYYRYDSKENWETAPPTLHVEPGAQLLFRVEPDGAAAFPLDEPVWTVAGATMATGSQQFAWQAPAASQATATDITVSCGTQSLTTAVRVVTVARLQWKLDDSDDLFQDVPASGNVYLPSGAVVLVRAVPSPGDADWPGDAPVWTGAQGKATRPDRATAVLGTTAVTVQAAVPGQADPPGLNLNPLTIESISLRGTGAGDTWGGTIATRSGSPGISVPVGLQGTFSVKFQGHPAETPPAVGEHLLVWTGDGFPIAQRGLGPSTAWDAVSAGVDDRQVVLTFGAHAWTVPLTVVGIDKLEYTGDGTTWQEAEGVVIVGPSTSPQVRAVPLPNGAEFPATFPRWSGVTPGGAGTAPVVPTFTFGNGNTGSANVTATCGEEAQCRFLMFMENIGGIMVLPDRIALEANVNDTSQVNRYAWYYYWPDGGGGPPTGLMLMPEPGNWDVYKDFGPDATATLVESTDGTYADVTALEPGSITIWTTYPWEDPPELTDPCDLVLDSVALSHLTYSIGPADTAGAPATPPDAEPVFVQDGTQINLYAQRLGGGGSTLWPPERPDWTMPVTGEDGVPTQSVRLDGIAQGGWYEAKCGKAKDENGVLQDCVDGMEVVVCSLGSLTVDAAGLSTVSRTDTTTYTDPVHCHDTLYVGPDTYGRINFEISVGWNSTGNDLDPSHVKWAIECPAAQGGWATVTTGDDYGDGTFGGFWLPNGTPATGDPVSGDMTDGNPIYVSWQLPRTTDYRLDTLRVRVWFDDTVKHEGTAHELCVPLTIVKPDMVIHRPKEADDNEPPITFENEEDPGLYLSVNDDWDSGLTDATGAPLPDCSDTEIPRQDPTRSSDLADMARLDLTALYALAGCHGWSLRFSATGTGRVRLFREGHDEQLWYSGGGAAELDGRFKDLARMGQSLYVEGVTPGDVVLTLEAVDHSGNAVGAEMVRLIVIKVGLAATGLDGPVADYDEETPGVFLHFNLDNDNGSINTLGFPKHCGGDYLETGPVGVADEDDLLSLTLSIDPVPDEGSVVLRIANGRAVVWGNEEKGSANLLLPGPGALTWDLSDTTPATGDTARFLSLVASGIWVEGVDGGKCVVELTYRDASGAEVTTDAVNDTFVAADCGDQPTTQVVGPDDINWRAHTEGLHANLVHCEWSVTAKANDSYNCFAWSVGITTRHVWGELDDDNDGVILLSEFDEFYADSGFEPCTIEEADILLFKSPLFQTPHNPVGITHAARRAVGCDCGASRWRMYESKQGHNLRIEHRRDQLNGGSHGEHFRYYKKQ